MSSTLLLAIWLAVAQPPENAAAPASVEPVTAPGPEANSPQAILRSADVPRKSLVNSEVTVHAIVSEADKPDRTFDMNVYIGSRERELVVFTDAREKGRKFLMSGNKSWLLVSGSRHPIAISPNQRMVGSFSFSDLARIRLSTDYSGALRQQQEPCGMGPTPAPEPCHVVDITAKTRKAPYASGTLWVDAQGVLRRAIYALPSGKAAKLVEYRYMNVKGKPVLSEMRITDLLMPAQHLVTTLKFGERHPLRLSDKDFEPEYALTH